MYNREYNTAVVNRYNRKRRAEGWKYMHYLVPPDVFEKINKFKNELMTQYRASKG